MQKCRNPKHFQLLSDTDQETYKEMQAYFLSHAMSSKNCGESAFQDTIDRIRSFCLRKDEDDWKRSVVCGICWMTNNVLISVQQLQVLLGKCKSSINGSFHRLHYTSCGPRVNLSDVADEIPFFNSCPGELRRWTLRVHKEDTPCVTESADDSDILDQPELYIEPYMDYFNDPIE